MSGEGLAAGRALSSGREGRNNCRLDGSHSSFSASFGFDCGGTSHRPRESQVRGRKFNQAPVLCDCRCGRTMQVQPYLAGCGASALRQPFISGHAVALQVSPSSEKPSTARA